jgi:hypothetical protein
MRGFQDLIREKLSSLFVMLGWSSISIASLMMRSMHPVFLARTLVAVTQVNVVLCHCLYIRMVNSDTPMVLFDPDLDGMPGLSNVDLVTFTEDAVYARCF